ncbi:MAG TPA: hypothetical protein VG052_08125 [Puia sp.]|jgi:hypothetical protein|nr:hypothetical protein [Puia sp.]
MKKPLTLFVLFSLLLFSACRSSNGDRRAPGQDTLLVDAANPQLPPLRHNPEFRAQIKKEPAAEYNEKTGNIAGDFAVRLYQTPKTMYYRVEVEYEGLPGSDTVKLPDLGNEPHPVLQKGSDKYSCIIGFLDNDKQFREIKLVHAKGDQLKISTLRHWVVRDHYRLVSQ